MNAPNLTPVRIMALRGLLACGGSGRLTEIGERVHLSNTTVFSAMLELLQTSVVQRVIAEGKETDIYMVPKDRRKELTDFLKLHAQLFEKEEPQNATPKPRPGS